MEDFSQEEGSLRSNVGISCNSERLDQMEHGLILQKHDWILSCSIDAKINVTKACSETVAYLIKPRSDNSSQIFFFLMEIF